MRRKNAGWNWRRWWRGNDAGFGQNNCKRTIAAIERARNDTPIRTIINSIALVTCAACSPQQPAENEKIMRAIESAVKLPVNAKAFKEYSRNYAFRPDGKVVAIYVIPRSAQERESEFGCEVMLKNFGSRSCTHTEKVEVANQEKRRAKRFGHANQSRWFGDYRELPLLMDGGCDLIEIIYNPRLHRIQSAQCNGEA